MDPQVVQFAQTAGTTVVALMATEAWSATRDRVVALWQRFRPGDVDGVEAALDEARAQIVLAREGESEAEDRLAGEWQGRMVLLLTTDPSTAPALERVLREARELLPPGEQSSIGSVRISAHATGNSHVYQAGRDLHITERSVGRHTRP
ncbi:hypothetical protein [Streptomyces violaceorubidus]|uniref:hypothetical protein n=1 Tax=Streptomyces violaceorubidus TaxID=284042 RepID=UPI0004C1F121|nr:hypothetical protein [Streptomyces violaceorubidus]